MALPSADVSAAFTPPACPLDDWSRRARPRGRQHRRKGQARPIIDGVHGNKPQRIERVAAFREPGAARAFPRPGTSSPGISSLMREARKRSFRPRMNEVGDPMNERPNFLIIMTDQQRADWLGAAGHPVLRTPHIDALAAGGARFENFHVASPVCMPNRATVMTGRYPSVHGLRYNGCSSFRLDKHLRRRAGPGRLPDGGHRQEPPATLHRPAAQMGGRFRIRPDRRRLEIRRSISATARSNI